MPAYSANASWIVERGDEVIQKKASTGMDSLSPWERLVYCLWVADYGMRNAGDLTTAKSLYGRFQTEGRQIAKQLSLAAAHEAFSLSKHALEREYFDRFESICDELKRAEPG
jgi:hypothetical protein